jgi:hypothetical protein
MVVLLVLCVVPSTAPLERARVRDLRYLQKVQGSDTTKVK